MADETEHKVYVGPAGWAYQDWEGIVYPVRKGKDFDSLGYISEYFDVVEINHTFYNFPSEKLCESWVGRILHREDFKFTIKLHQRFTHDWREITSKEIEDFKAGIRPIFESGRLGCILAQFSWSQKYLPDSSQRLKRLIEMFIEYPFVIEVRDPSWDNELVHQLLGEKGVGLCNIDESRLRKEGEVSEEEAGRIGYFRLHGQDVGEWFKEDADRDERYEHLYTMEELAGWIERIRALWKQRRETYVITNNNHRGKSIANALQLEFMLYGTKVFTPEQMHSSYPELKDISKNVAEQETMF